MSCSIEQLIYDYENPELVKELNLSATSRIKIHAITHLQPFSNLRSLILSNNMIHRIDGVQHLRQLRILNLQFNQIKILENTDTLHQLEQLYLSYNDISEIGKCLLNNRKLKILHLAYNDIKGLEDISVLYALKDQQDDRSQSRLQESRYALSQLNTLSLYGNPVIASINYLSFLKMLIPSLAFIDDHNVNQILLTNNVCPQEEVAILREALNKLLDQRNAAFQQLESYVDYDEQIIQQNSKFTSKRGKNKNYGEKSQQKSTYDFQYAKFKQIEHKKKNQLKQWKILLQTGKQKYTKRMKGQKSRISQLSEQYTSAIKRKRQFRDREGPQVSGISYLNFQDQGNEGQNMGQYSPEKAQKMDKSLIKELEQDDYCRNKKIMKEIRQLQKQAEQNMKKIRNINKIMEQVDKTVNFRSNQYDLYLQILQFIVFGFEEVPQNRQELQEKCYKLCKKFLIDQHGPSEEQKGVLFHVQLLKSIIFGNHSSVSSSNISSNPLRHSDPYALKQKIKDKNLLEIIADLKTINCKERKELGRFQKDRKQFIDKFEAETQELALGWEQLNKQRQIFQQTKQKELKQLNKIVKEKHQQAMKKYKNVEEEEKEKIKKLKSERSNIQCEINELEKTFNEAEEALTRKFIELEEFQAHFNQFIQQKQKMRSLEAELGQITMELQKQQDKMNQYTEKVKELRLEQGILGDRLENLDQQIRLRNKQLKEIEGNMDKIQFSYAKSHQQLSSSMIKLRQINSDILNKSEELKDIEKLLQRNKKNYILMEDKMRNIDQMETNKKTNIKELESEIRVLKDQKASIFGEIENMEKKIQSKREQLVRCQLKIQENKLAMESLADLNRSINDMLIRQSELKRNIIELEIENKNLLEMKNNLLQDFRMKQYI